MCALLLKYFSPQFYIYICRMFYTSKNPEKILPFSPKIEDFFSKWEFFTQICWNSEIQEIWVKNFHFEKKIINFWNSANFSKKIPFEKKILICWSKAKIFSTFLAVYVSPMYAWAWLVSLCSSSCKLCKFLYRMLQLTWQYRNRNWGICCSMGNKW